VALNGNDSWSGRLPAPNAQNNDGPFKTIQKTAGIVQPGDTVYIRGGTYYRTGASENNRIFTLTNVHGTANATIRFTSYNGEEVIFRGQIDQSTDTSAGFEIRDCSYLVFDHLIFEKFKGAAFGIHANSVGSSHHITVDHCEGRFNDRSPNYHPGAFGTYGAVRHITFRNLLVHNNFIGILLYEAGSQTKATASTPPLEGNNAPGSPSGGYTSDMPPDQWSAWPGWTDIAAQHCVVENCVVFLSAQPSDWSSGGPVSTDGIVARYAVDCIFRNNVLFSNADDNLDVVGATRAEIAGNISFRCRRDPETGAILDRRLGDGNGLKCGVRGGLDHLIHHNVSFDNFRCALDTAQCERPRVYNNTFLNSYGHETLAIGLWLEPFRLRGPEVNLRVLNNIIQISTRFDTGRQKYANYTIMAEADGNCLSDANDHGWAYPQGPKTLVSTDAKLVDRDFQLNLSGLNTLYPGPTYQQRSIEQKLAFVRDQVVPVVQQKFKPQIGVSPCINGGVLIPGITDGFQGSAPDIGALEVN
jgi:hypothetical protein